MFISCSIYVSSQTWDALEVRGSWVNCRNGRETYGFIWLLCLCLKVPTVFWAERPKRGWGTMPRLFCWTGELTSNIWCRVLAKTDHQSAIYKQTRLLHPVIRYSLLNMLHQRCHAVCPMMAVRCGVSRVNLATPRNRTVSQEWHLLTARYNCRPRRL